MEIDPALAPAPLSPSDPFSRITFVFFFSKLLPTAVALFAPSRESVHVGNVLPNTVEARATPSTLFGLVFTLGMLTPRAALWFSGRCLVVHHRRRDGLFRGHGHGLPGRRRQLAAPRGRH